MFVNPFERMKKIREEKELKEREEKEEKEKYAKLGVQLGFSSTSDGIVPSFMKGMMSDDNSKANVPPFGISNDFDFAPSSPSPSNAKKTINNDNLKNLSLPGGGGAPSQKANYITPDINGFIEPDHVSFNSENMFDNFTESQKDNHNNNVNIQNQTPAPNISKEPMPESSFAIPGSQVSEMDLMPMSDPIQSNVNVSAQIKSTIPKQTVNSESQNGFFGVEGDVVDQINMILQTPLENLGELEAVMTIIKDAKNSNQFFATFGGKEETELADKKIASHIDNKIIINMRKMHSYIMPYLFAIKKIVNGIEEINEEDKNVLWSRIALFLSSTEYGKKDEEIESLLDDELSLSDPIALACGEFIEVFEAYEITNKPYLVILKDYRGLNFEAISKSLSFITGLFGGIFNLKFLFELPQEIYLTQYRLSSASSWMTMFDLVVQLHSTVEIEKNEELFEPVTSSLARPQAEVPLVSSPSFETQSAGEMRMPEIPLAPNIENRVPTPPSFDSNHKEQQMFQVPSANQSNNITPVTKRIIIPDKEANVEDDAIRIKVSALLEKTQREEQELELWEQQQKRNQLVDSTIDASVLEDSVGDPTGKVDFSVFNAVGYHESMVHEGDLLRPQNNDGGQIPFDDSGTHDQIKTKLDSINGDLQSYGGINIPEHIRNKEEIPSPQIKIPGLWDQLK